MKIFILALALAALAACDRGTPARGSSASEGKAAQSAGGGSADEGKAARRAGK